MVARKRPAHSSAAVEVVVPELMDPHQIEVASPTSTMLDQGGESDALYGPGLGPTWLLRRGSVPEGTAALAFPIIASLSESRGP